MAEVEILGRMAVTAIVLGTVTAIVGTGRVTVSLVVSGALMWSFVPVLQLLTGLVVVRTRAGRRTTLRAYFACGHYWLLWLLALAVVFLFWPDPGFAIGVLAATGLVPMALTIRALRRLVPWPVVVLHQALTLGLLLGYIAWAIGGATRLAEIFP